MALPKGVKSQVDYTKLYMSNELDGEVLLEKEPELPKFTKDKNKSFQKPKVKKFTDYTGVKPTFKDFTKKGGISGFVNRRFGSGTTKFPKGIISSSGLAKGARGGVFGKGVATVAKGLAKTPKGALVAGGLIGAVAGARAIGNLFNRGYSSDKNVYKGGYGKGNKGLPPGSEGKPTHKMKQMKIRGVKEETISEKALSKKQQRFFGIVRAIQKGEQEPTTPETAKAAQDMKKSDVKKYASTKHAKLPEKKKVDEVFLPEILDKKDVPHVKKLVKKLRDGSKTHAKQADELEVAMKTENTAIESELVIQDWNSDDIKFTEIETVDIIKAKPLKESMSNWREELGEDWQKVNRNDKTDGLSRKAVKAYRRENPGSKLQTAVTKDPKKLKKGSKSAKRRLSFCRRMKGMKKKLTSAKTRRDPDSRINKALRRWNC